MHLLASILAVWSIKKTYYGHNQQIICKTLPHPVQILALILLIERAKPSLKVLSQLAQINTGEGKSIILATMATYYARLGFVVNVACYSDYLSKRDYKEFEFLFEAFKVHNKIKYGTFNEICERVLNNEKGNLKQIIKQYLTESESQNKVVGFVKNAVNSVVSGITHYARKIANIFNESKTKQSAILLVDQVDVFFEKDYLGELYRPVVGLDQQ